MKRSSSPGNTTQISPWLGTTVLGFFSPGAFSFWGEETLLSSSLTARKKKGPTTVRKENYPSQTLQLTCRQPADCTEGPSSTFTGSIPSSHIAGQCVPAAELSKDWGIS